MAKPETPKTPSRPDAASQQVNTPFKALAAIKTALPEQPKPEAINVTVREPGVIENTVIEVKINA